MLLRIMEKEKNKDYPITVRLEEDEYNYVSRLSEDEDRSLSVVARYLVLWGMAHHKKTGKLVYKDDDTDPKGTAGSDAGKKESGSRTRTGTRG